MPIVSAFTPPTGPVQGGTLLTLTGAKLDGGGLGGHGTLTRCRFGKEVLAAKASACEPYTDVYSPLHSDCRYDRQVVPATYGDERDMMVYGPHSAAGSLGCFSPARPDATPLNVEVSLNAQQYSADRTGFAYYRDTVLEWLHPLSGPALGGTLVTMAAAELANGTDYRCRFFGAGRSVAEFTAGESRATIDVAGGGVKCYSPPYAPGLAAYPSATVVAVRLTKNGQNYMDSSLTFTYYAQPSVKMYDPPGGKFEGNTSTRLDGSFFGGSHYVRYGGVKARHLPRAAEHHRVAHVIRPTRRRWRRAGRCSRRRSPSP